MSDWSAAEKADATTVSRAIRLLFAGQNKANTRSVVADYFAPLRPEVIVDLWGGGASAEFLRSRFPNARIVSVENGSVCDDKERPLLDGRGRRISKERVRRAHAISAHLGGYEAFWGNLSDLPLTPDCAWANLCGRWPSAEASAAMRALAGSKRVALTIAAERDEMWQGHDHRSIAIVADLAYTAWMRTDGIELYVRNPRGQFMALFLLESTAGRRVVSLPLLKIGKCLAKSFRYRRAGVPMGRMVRRSKNTCSKCGFVGIWNTDNRYPDLCRKCRTHEYWIDYRAQKHADPEAWAEYLAAANSRTKLSIARRGEAGKAKRREYRREYLLRPDVRERRLAWAAEYRKKRRADPAYVEKAREYQREYQRKYRLRQKQAAA